MFRTTVGYQKRAQWDFGSAGVVLGEVVFASVVNDDEEEDLFTAFSSSEAL